MCACVRTYVCACVRACVSAYLRVCVLVCVYIHVQCTYACTHVCTNPYHRASTLCMYIYVRNDFPNSSPSYSSSLLCLLPSLPLSHHPFLFSEGFAEERIRAVLHQIELGLKHQSSSFGLSLIMVSVPANNLYLFPQLLYSSGQ